MKEFFLILMLTDIMISPLDKHVSEQSRLFSDWFVVTGSAGQYVALTQEKARKNAWFRISMEPDTNCSPLITRKAQISHYDREKYMAAETVRR